MLNNFIKKFEWLIKEVILYDANSERKTYRIIMNKYSSHLNQKLKEKKGLEQYNINVRLAFLFMSEH